MKKVFLLSILLPLFLFAEQALPQIRSVPWLSEDAIAFLEDFLQKNPNARILEFGSGASTVWFSKRTTNLVSIEHNLQWYNYISNIINDNKDCNAVNYYLLERPYYTVCNSFSDGYFDLILVDGRNRKGCIVNCLRLVRPGGILMLDNSERKYYHSVYDLMQNWEMTITEQKKPDSHGFYYTEWETRWWKKPLN